MKLKNNSCRGIYRSYTGFELHIPGYFEGELPVPAHFVADVSDFLRKHHPLVQVEADTEAADAFMKAFESVREVAAAPVAVETEAPAAIPDQWAKSFREKKAVKPQAAKPTPKKRR